MFELQIKSSLIIRIKDLQQQDPEILQIIAKPDAKANVNFSLHPDGLLYFKNWLCVPNNEELRKEILKEAHQSSFSIHPGTVKMYQDLNSLYWWPGPTGLLQPLEFLQWKWDRIAMDFVTGLPISPKKNDTVWVIVDRLTKSTHFISVRVNALGTKVHLSTVVHPQTYGQSERIIQVLEDMLRACVIDFGKNWDKYLPLVEFAYNNSYQASIQMAHFEALYGRRGRTPLCWSELDENKVLGPQLIRDTEEKIQIIHEKLKQAFDWQKAYVDLKRRDIQYEVGDKAFLKVSPW
ncbi:hypothetical protein V6N13_008770 [Hibiscus sabdariffa]